MSRRVIFLDFDGVLTNTNTKFMTADPACVARLNEITDATGAEIVVSSTWRHAGLGKTRQHLKDWGATGKVVDVTPDCSHEENGVWRQPCERGDEIAAWLARHPDVDAYVILDDDADMGALMHKLVRTDTHAGLSAVDVERAIARLRDLR